LQADPRSRDLVLFHEYFHGDNGRGVGASHQTGWTGLVALLLQPRAMAASGNVPLAGEPDRAPMPTSTSAPAPACPPESAPEPAPALATAVTK
jgi:hypothetical protein